MSRSKCCVLGCQSFPPHFKFPTSRILIRKWLAALGPRCDYKTDPNGSVCSRHFASEEWECARGRVRLKKGVVPSRFDEVPNHDTATTDNVPNEKANEHITNDTQDIFKFKQKDDSGKDNDSGKDSNSDKEAEKERVQQNDKKDSIKDSDSKEIVGESDQKKDKLGEDISNGKENGEERIQENKETEGERRSSLDSKKNKDKSKESIPKLPSSPRDIDKQDIDKEDKDKVEDIEELLTPHHIKQNNIHNTEDLVVENGEVPVEVELGSVEADPVFIEISVDKDNTTAEGDRNDCLMVLESVQVEVDPSALMLQERDYREEVPMETVEIDAQPADENGDPISLLTSSDEDDVIIQEPHIDTVEVSDETDEDDMPLVKLLRKRRAEKKKNMAKRAEKKEPIAKITWGTYEYYCVQCHYKTSIASDYRRHMSAHAKVILMCQLCGYMTASSSQFAKHEKQHGEKTYKCHLCDFKAKRNMSLVYHMKTHNQKEFKCGECDFVAFSDQAILRHLRFCNDGKRHKCDKCSYSSKKRSDLKRHQSRKHDDDKDADYVPPARCMD